MPIRKRPVSFGNPALGTYKGFVYTLEGSKNDTNYNVGIVPKPLLEGSQAVERMVAMVNVPPEQVPEGILNLARSHRPYIEHVRIVIGEPEEETTTTPLTAAAAAALLGGAATIQDDDLLAATTSPLLAPATDDAASLLAADVALRTGVTPDIRPVTVAAAVAAMDPLASPALTVPPSSSTARSFLKWSESEGEDEENRRPERSYLVLFHLQTEEDADTMVEDLHGRPYTSLDETVTCSVHTVVALQGEGGVSLLNPMFAPATKKKHHGTLEILPPAPSGENDEEDGSDNLNKEKTLSKESSFKVSANATTAHLTEDPNCAVCLEHMSLDPNAEDKTSILTTVCNHTFHLDCLVQCQDSPCPVCRYDHSGLNEALSQCHICGTTERNYVCLICGVVSCVSGSSAAVLSSPPRFRNQAENNTCGTGNNTARAPANSTPNRSYPSQQGAGGGGEEPMESSEATAHRFYTSHANQHYDETLHAYALDTETQHVWDFAGQGYVHRLLQNKEDGKLVEVSDPNNTTSQERSLTPGLSDAQEGEVVHRKLEGFASQYYTLLKSQLEQQRTFYEGRLEEIRREFAMKKANAASDKADLMSALRQEKKQLSSRLQNLKRKHTKVADDVAFLKSMNDSLQANKTPLEHKIKQAQRERIESREMFQTCLPTLEEKVTTLMLQLEESLDSGGGASESKRDP